MPENKWWRMTDKHPIDHAEITCPQDKKALARPQIIQDCYNAKWRIAQKYQPETIFEIGVMTGYSAHAFVTGSDRPKQYIGWDADDRAHYGGPWLYWARHLLEGLDVAWRVDEKDSQTVERLFLPFDLIHVDGDHSHKGCLHDMRLCWPAVNPGGVMVVDDATYLPGPRQACRDFSQEVHGARLIYLELSPAGSMVYEKEGG